MKESKIIKTNLGSIDRYDSVAWKPYFDMLLSGEKSQNKISEELGIDCRTLSGIFTKLGWLKSSKTHIRTKQGFISKESKEDWVIYHDMYMLKDKSYEEVSEYMGIDRGCLKRYLEKFEFPKRSMHDSVMLAQHKTVRTNMTKLGVPYPMMSRQVHAKSIDTCLNKYGVSNVGKVVELRNQDTDKNREHLKNVAETSIGKWSKYLVEKGYSLEEEFSKGIRNCKVAKEESSWVKYQFKHELCGTNFQGYFHVNGIRCPKCFPNNISLPEKNILGIVKRLLGEDVEVRENVSILDGRHIDIYIPSLKIGFEYNGNYWHTNKQKNDTNYHKSKTDIALSKGIRLYHIWEYEDSLKVESKLKSILGKIDVKYRHSKLQIKSVSTSEQREFLDINHLHGYLASTFCFGYYTKDEKLVSLISFNVKRDNSCELVRFCNIMDSKIFQGFSRLLKHSIKYLKAEYPCTSSVFSYAYRDWTPDPNSNVYMTNGFTLDGILSPSLRYYNDNDDKVYTRQTYMKHKLMKLFPSEYSDNLTADQILDLNRIYPMYDSGNLKFIMDI